MTMTLTTQTIDETAEEATVNTPPRRTREEFQRIVLTSVNSPLFPKLCLRAQMIFIAASKRGLKAVTPDELEWAFQQILEVTRQIRDETTQLMVAEEKRAKRVGLTGQATRKGPPKDALARRAQRSERDSTYRSSMQGHNPQPDKHGKGGKGGKKR
jgi:hypothetical protein